MTKSGRPAAEAGERDRCRWCGRVLEHRAGPGRRRRYCRQGCRQQAFMARKLARAHGLGDDDVIVARAKVEELQSHLYVLQAALEDVERDLAQGNDDRTVRDALAWLRENCEPIRDFWIEPRTIEG